MLLKTRGTPVDIDAPIVGTITRNPIEQNKILIAETHSEERVSSNRFAAILTSAPAGSIAFQCPAVFDIATCDHLAEGDIVVIHADGVVNTLYRVHSHQNFLLATERCNSNCLMCSQPPKDRDDTGYLYDIYCKLIPLIPKDCIELGITGGEPTLLGERFFQLLELIQEQLPDTEVHCLTNGRTFAWNNLAERLGRVGLNRLMLGIPLYSDHYQAHDYIVQARGAFDQTIAGLYNLAAANTRIEIRIVLHKQSIPRLTRLARFIYKNLPFVEHIAFMGLEYQGYTPFNIEKLWIDPVDYMDALQEAADYLSDKGMNVSIYNSQLCLMPESLWKYNKRSISDWKNIYLEQCRSCALLERCGGLFASCDKMHSPHIKPFTEEPISLGLPIPVSHMLDNTLFQS